MAPRRKNSVMADVQKRTARDETRKNLSVVIGLGVVLASMSITQTKAQTRDESSSAGASAGLSLAEITVTARRRSESAQTVPTTIAAVSADDLQERQIKDVSEIMFLVPTLRVSATEQGQQTPAFSLRGLRSNGVVLYFAEVPAIGDSVGRELYDLDSVQVLKGPQGTLFGTNTTAGAILFGPARPKDATEGFIESNVGDYGAFGLQAMFNAPLTSTLFLRVAGQEQRRDGLVTIDTALVPGSKPRAQDSVDFRSGRASLLWTPSAAFENLLIVDRFYSDEDSSSRKLVGYQPCPPNPSPLQQFIVASCHYIPPLSTSLGYPSFNEFAAAEMALKPFKTLVPFQGNSVTDSYGITDQATVHINDKVSLKNIFGYRSDKTFRSLDGDGTPFAIIDAFPGYTTHHYSYSNESQLQLDTEKLKAIVGLFYSNTYIAQEQQFEVLAPSPLGPIDRFSNVTDKTYAIFSQGTYAVTDKLNLTAGLRYTWERKNIRQREFTQGACSLVPPNANVDFATCTFTGDANSHEPSWTVAADYKLADKTLAYVTARRGFNSGGINNAPPIGYKTEIIDDVEIGIKNDARLAGVPVRTNIAVFRSKYSDIQRNITTYIDGQPRTFIKNAASATVLGVEIENEARLGDFDLSAAVSYIHAKYNDFNTELSPGVLTDLTNNSLANAPKTTATVTVAYHVPISHDFSSDLRAAVTGSYQSTVYFSDINQSNTDLSNRADPFTQQGQYTILNADLTASDFLKAGFGASIFVKNLTNKLYASNKESAMSLFGYSTAIYGDPRTWGVSASYRF